MSYDIEVDSGRESIELAYYNPCNLEEVRRGRKEMLKACEENGIRKILLDLSQVNTMRDRGLSITDCFFLAESWCEETRPLRMVLSCVMPTERGACERVSFYITTAKNRGIVIEGFGDTESAREWLAGM